MSLLQFCKYKAKFVDDNGDYVGSKVFHRSTGGIGVKKKTFVYNGGEYNIKTGKASRLFNTNFFDIFFDEYMYVYQVGNPDPISFKNHGFEPIMEPQTYHRRLNSNLVRDLQSAAKKKIDIDWRWLVGGAVIILLVYYFATGGTFSGEVADGVNKTIATTLGGAN